MNKFYLSAIISACSVCSNIQAENTAELILLPSENLAAFTAVSPNGKYACGYSNGLSVIYDETQNQVTYLGDESATEYYAFSAIADDGTAIGSYSYGDVTVSRPIIMKGLDIINLKLPDGADSGAATSISQDGHIITGWSQKDIYVTPCVWIDQELKVLKFPSKDPYGLDALGAIAKFVAPDGTIHGNYNLYTGTALIARWTNLDEECELLFDEYTFNYDSPITMQMPIFEEWVTAELGSDERKAQLDVFNAEMDKYLTQMENFTTGILANARATYYSADGRYLISTMNNEVENTYVPFRYDFNTKEMTSFSDYTDAIALSVTNNGDVTIGTPNYSVFRMAEIYFNDTKKIEGFKEWMSAVYGTDIMDISNGFKSVVPDMDYTGSILFNADGTRIYGYIFDEAMYSYNYVVRLSQFSGVSNTKADNQMIITPESITSGNYFSTQIFDMKGNLKLSAQGTTSVDLKSLEKGVYLAKFNVNGINQTKKIVIR